MYYLVLWSKPYIISQAGILYLIARFAKGNTLISIFFLLKIEKLSFPHFQYSSKINVEIPENKNIYLKNFFFPLTWVHVHVLWIYYIYTSIFKKKTQYFEINLNLLILNLISANRKPGDPCDSIEYQCTSGDQCVPASYQCDGEIDCQDRSDEIGCGEYLLHCSTQNLLYPKYYDNLWNF